MEMVDRYDDVVGFTSMARTTAFTGAIVARLIARGEIESEGMLTPGQVISGPVLVIDWRVLAPYQEGRGKGGAISRYNWFRGAPSPPTSVSDLD